MHIYLCAIISVFTYDHFVIRTAIIIPIEKWPQTQIPNFKHNFHKDI